MTPIERSADVAVTAIPVPAQTPAPPVQPSATPVFTPVTPHLGQARPVLLDRAGDTVGWLFGSAVYRFIVAEHLSVVDLSADVFVDSDQNAKLDYAARRADGLPLPDWLMFDARTQSFHGKPPAGFSGRIDLQVLATDQNNNRATADVHLIVGREQKDLVRLLRVGEPAPPRVAPAPPAARAAAPGRGQPARPAPDRHHAPRPAAARPVTEPAHQAADRVAPAPATVGSELFAASPLAGKAGLASQLRGAGAAGRMAQQRRFLAGVAAGHGP